MISPPLHCTGHRESLGSRLLSLMPWAVSRVVLGPGMIVCACYLYALSSAAIGDVALMGLL